MKQKLVFKRVCIAVLLLIGINIKTLAQHDFSHDPMIT